MSFIKHFGVHVRAKSSGLKLTKDNYVENINFKDLYSKKYYTDSVIKDCIEERLYNFDKNMRYFASLSKEEFNKELNHFVVKIKTLKKLLTLHL